MNNPDFPISLGDLLSALAVRDMLHHVSLSSTTCGKWQASVKRPDTSRYCIKIHRDPVTALQAALGPRLNETWVSLIGEELADLFEEDEEDVEDIL